MLQQKGLHLQSASQYSLMSNHDSSLSSEFEWLEHLMYYLPIWTSEHNSKCCTFFMFFMIFICISYQLFTISLLNTHDIREYVGAFQTLSFVLSRVFCLKYAYKHYNHPWAYNIITKNHNKNVNSTKKYSRLIRIGVIALAILQGISRFVYYKALISRKVYYDFDLVILLPVYCTFAVFNYFMFFIPLVVCFGVSASIFVKYHLCLLQIMDSILESDSESVDFDKMLCEYRKAKKSFSLDFHPSLRMCILFKLLGLFTSLWFDTYKFINKTSSADDWRIYDAVMAIVWIILFVISASLLSDTFTHKFETELLEYGSISHGISYNYLLIYLNRNPLQVTIATSVISKKNAFLMFVGFWVAQFLSYTVAYFYS